MSLDPLSLLVGGVSGGLLGGVIPSLCGWYAGHRREKAELREFIDFVKRETEARNEGKGAGYWWNPLPNEVAKYAILSRLVQKGLLIYKPGFGFMLKEHP